MAFLTPGVLSKLLENAGNKDVSVTGEHRSALLQVVEILPSLAGAEDPWQSTGFFLKVSDSLHSAYVSIPDEDMDLIYSDKIQLGQFVYISRLDWGSPVPVLRGLKPVPRRRPCVGNPKDLVSSDLLPIKANVNVNLSKEKKGSKNESLTKTKKRAVDSKVEGLEMRRLSLDSARRIWDQTPTPKSSSHTNLSLKSSNSNVHLDKKASPKNDSTLKRPTLCVSPLKSKNQQSSPKVPAKPLKNDFKSAADRTIPSCLVKVPTSSKTWSEQEQRISWNVLPPTIQNLGKETVHHRNVAFLAAVSAVEEASVAENVIRCMQEFAELCKSPENIYSGSLVEQYLDLHQNMQKAAVVINSLLSDSRLETKSSFYNSQHCLSADVEKTKTSRSAASWLHAAIETNLSKFILFKKPEKSEMVNSNNCHYVVLENSTEDFKSENQSPQNNQRPRNNSNLSDSSPKQVPSLVRHLSVRKKMDLKREHCPKGNGLKKAASLAEKLLLHSRGWFLEYMEKSLNNGFQFCRAEGSEIACLLGQLKRVNQWLDDLSSREVMTSGRVEDLRKKLYEFLLEHVETAVAAVNR
ncbi:hypothetical protein JCGZ_05255 [Jatropha curcas]|uniref:DUF936 family protein n=1 Tax=Jatropha curcas TaxID=180498 RepID=A0A067J9E6_JATCU|nr:uncharacterized protein LOC105650319 [Jatropha curcas]KDP20372.1 hypothetical protein JCGZ_05255 [Jatropha curcas]